MRQDKMFRGSSFLAINKEKLSAEATAAPPAAAPPAAAPDKVNVEEMKKKEGYSDVHDDPKFAERVQAIYNAVKAKSNEAEKKKEETDKFTALFMDNAKAADAVLKIKELTKFPLVAAAAPKGEGEVKFDKLGDLAKATTMENINTWAAALIEAGKDVQDAEITIVEGNVEAIAKFVIAQGDDMGKKLGKEDPNKQALAAKIVGLLGTKIQDHGKLSDEDKPKILALKEKCKEAAGKTIGGVTPPNEGTEKKEGGTTIGSSPCSFLQTVDVQTLPCTTLQMVQAPFKAMTDFQNLPLMLVFMMMVAFILRRVFPSSAKKSKF